VLIDILINLSWRLVSLASKPLITAIILAAGKGTRMKSSLAKVLHELGGKPMIHHVLDAVSGSGCDDIVVVIGHQGDDVVEACSGYHAKFVTQEEQLGTGHAVLVTAGAVARERGVVLILCGDTPLISSSTLHAMLDQHLANNHFLTVMTTCLDDPLNYGRIIKDNANQIIAIVEEKDASDEQRKIREVNTGIYCVDRDFLFTALKDVGTDNAQGEVYLTDIIAMAHEHGQPIDFYRCDDSAEVFGINSRAQLEQAEILLQQRQDL